MRLFTALDLPADVAQNVEELLVWLRPKVRIQWTPVSNLHITAKFIGEWPVERLPEMRAALATLPVRPAIPIQIRQVGFFPNPHSPRVFNLGVHAPPLADLVNDTSRVLADLGFEAEKRAYMAHLTLARLKEKVDLQPLREAIAALPSQDFGRFEADRFFLYQSKLRPSGSVYTKLAEFPFSKR